MSEETKTPESEFTDAQIKALQEMYSYTDGYEYTPADLKLAQQMFDTPEKFLLLRKIFGVHTPNEKGLTMQGPQAVVEASITDMQAYAIETAVNHLANEKVRQALVAFYRVVRQEMVQKKADEFRAANKEEAEEKIRTEQFEKQQAEDERVLPVNV